MKIPESELIINGDGSAFHIHLKPEELADNVILVGDPGRVDMVSYYLDDIEFRHASREFVSVTGRKNGKRITVLSHGIGPDNIDIVMTELDALANVDFETREVKKMHRSLNIIRIGTSGALHADIPLGSFILSHVSVGFDGVMNWYEGRDSISMLDVEADFKKHMGWPASLPSPYFVKASPKIIKILEDSPCLICSRRSKVSASASTGLRISKWKVLRWQALPPFSDTTHARSAAPSPTAISRVRIRITNPGSSN